MRIARELLVIVILALLVAITPGAAQQAPSDRTSEVGALKPECAVLAEAWSAVVTAPAMRISGPPHDGKDHDLDVVIVGEASYRRTDGRWERGKINLLGRTILVNHTVGRVDPGSCRRIGEVNSDGETFATYSFASAPIYVGTYPYEEREVWVDTKGRLRAHSSRDGLVKYSYDGVRAPTE